MASGGAIGAAERLLPFVVSLLLLANAFLLLPHFIPMLQPQNCDAPAAGRGRPPTLVIYVYSETSTLKRNNLEFFLQHGLCETCHNINYTLIVNGPTEVKFPRLKNLEVTFYNNTFGDTCGDFGSWQRLFEGMDKAKYKRYKRFMFINDTVKGPYIDPNYYLLGKHFHFSDIFGSYMSNETRLVGSYINCNRLDSSYGTFSHVQTMSFMIDDVALEVVRPLMKCYPTKTDTITNGEIGLSRRLISQNINIGSLLYAFRGVDFRTNMEMQTNCNQLQEATYDGMYYGMTPNPMEVVFVKNTRGNDMRMMDRYAEWTSKANYTV